MKKILYLSLVASSAFSMQLDLVKINRSPETNMFQEKLSKQISNNKVHINPASVFVPEKLGSVELYHGKKGFHVRQDDKKHEIKKYFTDPMVRNITPEQLEAFLKAGYLSLNQMDDGEFSLKANGRINGGGLLFGKIAYWTTKTVCYTVVLTGVAVIALTGGAKISDNKKFATGVAAGGTAWAVAREGINTGVEMGAEAIYSAGIGSSSLGVAGVLATGAANAGYAEPCAKLTVAAGTAVHGSYSTGLIGAIEALSLTVGVLCGMAPTP